MPRVTLNGTEYELEKFKVSKGVRAITLVSAINKLAPELTKEGGRITREYGQEHFTELSRAQAFLRYGHPMPVFNEDGTPVLDVDGTVITTPAPITKMTEADWERSDHKLRIPESPPSELLMFELIPFIMEKAQEPVFRLFALVLMPNKDVTAFAANGTLWDRVDDIVNGVIMEADIDELMDLAMTAAELVDNQVRTKVKAGEEKWGNALRLFGWKRETTSSLDPAIPTKSSEQPEQPSSTSSSPSSIATTGTPEPSGTSPGTPSETSPSDTPVTVGTAS